MNAVTLPPELERFADEAVAAGRFSDVADVVRAGLSLLQRVELRRAAFEASLDAAIADSEQNGFVTLDESMAEIDAIIEGYSGSRK